MKLTSRIIGNWQTTGTGTLRIKGDHIGPKWGHGQKGIKWHSCVINCDQNRPYGAIKWPYGTPVLKLEITALEAMGLGRTISNPKVFTLDNMMAKVTQGQQIPYKTAGEGGFTTSFKDAALVLEVTPSIIGDGNVLLDIKVNNDTPDTSSTADEPPINKMEIITKWKFSLN